MLKQMDHANVVVRDLDAACRFYRDVLGLRESFRTVLQGDWIDEITGLHGVEADCVFFEFPDGVARLELLRFRQPGGLHLHGAGQPHGFGLRHIAFLVDDLDGLVLRLREAGVDLVSGPVTVPFPVGETGRTKRLLYFHDPEGVLFEAAEYGA